MCFTANLDVLFRGYYVKSQDTEHVVLDVEQFFVKAVSHHWYWLPGLQYVHVKVFPWCLLSDTGPQVLGMSKRGQLMRP